MNKKPLDYQTILKLPVKQSFKYGYGLLNNVIHLDIPVKNTNIKVQLNITVNDIFKKHLKFSTVYAAVNGGTSMSDAKTFQLQQDY